MVIILLRMLRLTEIMMLLLGLMILLLRLMRLMMRSSRNRWSAQLIVAIFRDVIKSGWGSWAAWRCCACRGESARRRSLRQNVARIEIPFSGRSSRWYRWRNFRFQRGHTASWSRGATGYCNRTGRRRRYSLLNRWRKNRAATSLRLWHHCWSSIGRTDTSATCGSCRYSAHAWQGAWGSRFVWSGVSFLQRRMTIIRRWIIISVAIIMDDMLYKK